MNGADSHGQTVLVWGAYKGTPEMAELLVRSGAGINLIAGSALETPLHYAALFGRLEMCLMLVRLGADTTLRNAKGITPRGKVSDTMNVPQTTREDFGNFEEVVALLHAAETGAAALQAWEQHDRCRVVFKGRVNARCGPSLEAEAITSLPTGHIVRATATKGDWVQLGSVEGRTDCWMLSKSTDGEQLLEKMPPLATSPIPDLAPPKSVDSPAIVPYIGAAEFSGDGATLIHQACIRVGVRVMVPP